MGALYDLRKGSFMKTPEAVWWEPFAQQEKKKHEFLGENSSDVSC